MIHIITGPNMGGKSTYLRQNALCVLMAQCGLRVPADKMVFRPCDGIFARVGTGDHIAKRQSTFMTEMVEVSSILHHATANSFIIFDELGRGTSTYDGMALSRSIIVYILEKIKAKTLLATHYHELIALEKKSALIQNFSVGVYETEKEIVFLKKIVAGGANKSYGIDVASLAGLPREIIEHAKHTLEGLSQHEKSSSPQSDTHTISKQEKKSDTDLFGDHKQSGQVSDAMRRKVEKINYFLAGIDIHHCTPLQALQFLAKIKDEWE
jgi:DNA mismatch repair protein MutS